MIRTLGLCALLCLLAGPSVAQVSCPATTWVRDVQSGQFTDPVFDSGLHCCGWHIQGDFPSGYSLASNSADGCGGEIPGSSVQKTRFTDRYTLTGPGSSPILVTAVFFPQFQITATTRCIPELNQCSCSSSSATVTLVRPGADSASVAWSPCWGVPSPTQVRLDLSLVPGASFDLAAALTINATCAGGTVSGILQIEGLPPGYTLDSCKGFHSVGAVAAKSRSWGALKQIYR